MTDQSSWAKGYADGKESLRGELEAHYAEVLQLRAERDEWLQARANDKRLREAQRALRRIINHWDEFGFENDLDEVIELGRQHSLLVDPDTDREHDPTIAFSDDAEFGGKP